MDIEKVKVNVSSLKAGGKVYLKDNVISKPFPPAITAEIRAVVQGESDTLEIIERTGDVKVTSPPVIEEQVEEETAPVDEKEMAEEEVTVLESDDTQTEKPDADSLENTENETVTDAVTTETVIDDKIEKNPELGSEKETPKKNSKKKGVTNKKPPMRQSLSHK